MFIGDVDNGWVLVLPRSYFTRQAAFLLKFASSTSDPELAARLVSKAADLKFQADTLPETDFGLKAPDVDPDVQG